MVGRCQSGMMIAGCQGVVTYLCQLNKAHAVNTLAFLLFVSCFVPLAPKSLIL